MEQDYPGGRNLVRKALELRDFPIDSLEIAMSSITESSYKQYDGCFKKWWNFCQDHSLDPFKGSVPDIIRFLTDIFNSGLSYNSVNCHRSAISLIVGPEIAEDSRIKRFFKGVAKKRPSKPKYDTTWDPKIVLDLFKSWNRNDELSMKDLSIKLITLLALITGHKMQSFSLIKIENIEHPNDLIEIKIPDRIKTSGNGKNQPTLILPYYKEENKLCVASTLKFYIEKIKELRKDIPNLFISIKRPFKAVTSQTLAHWVKEGLSNSGLNTDIYTAHSIRHASTSAAKRAGVDIDTLRKTAAWTSTSMTFAKFYDLLNFKFQKVKICLLELF